MVARQRLICKGRKLTLVPVVEHDGDVYLTEQDDG